MNKEHFLTELKLQLRALSPKTVEQILDDYNQIFEQELATGITEYQVSASLPTPKEIAVAILEELNITDTQNHPRTATTWEEFVDDYDTPSPQQVSPTYEQTDSPFVRFLQVGGLFCFNLFFMIWGIFAWMLFLFAGWVTEIVFLISPILGAFCLFLNPGPYAMVQFALSFVCFGIGLIGLLIAIPITKLSITFLKIYFQWNMRVIRGNN